MKQLTESWFLESCSTCCVNRIRWLSRKCFQCGWLCKCLWRRVDLNSSNTLARYSVCSYIARAIYTVQVASSEWTLGLQIQQIDYIPNVDIRDDLYCCCDTPPQVVPCSDAFANLNVEMCSIVCDYYCLVQIKDCSQNETCGVTEFYHLRSDTCSPYPLESVVFPIPFKESSEHGDQVSIQYTRKRFVTLLLKDC